MDVSNCPACMCFPFFTLPPSSNVSCYPIPSTNADPNQITYGTFFKACANLLPDDDEISRAIIKEAFQQCCKDGQVGEMVLTHLRSAAPPDLYHELVVKGAKLSLSRLSTRRVTVDDLPETWRSNVRERWKPKPAVRRQSAYHTSRKRSRP